MTRKKILKKAKTRKVNAKSNVTKGSDNQALNNLTEENSAIRKFLKDGGEIEVCRPGRPPSTASYSSYKGGGKAFHFG
jgi:hypothetical protein